MEDHWFDALNKVLVRANPRRTLLGAPAIMVSLGLSAPLITAARKGKGKSKGHRKGRGKVGKRKKKKSPPDPTQTCSGGLCQSRWPSRSDDDTRQRNWCEYVCELCKAPDNGPFCILGGSVADCCDEGLTCCNGFFPYQNEEDRQ